jgi:hypothetical protein
LLDHGRANRRFAFIILTGCKFLANRGLGRKRVGAEKIPVISAIGVELSVTAWEQSGQFFPILVWPTEKMPPSDYKKCSRT